jgi:hypothetical protein
METDWSDQNLQCFSFSFDGQEVWNVPILDNNYHWAYPNVHQIMGALAQAVRDNLTIAHNGAQFDFFILAHKYRIPVRRCYDTMLAMHRCYPDIEKSLGHCTSLFTWEPFHKDEDAQGYLTRQQMMDRLKYCGKDVYTMALIHKEIERYARTIPGLSDSISAAMDNIRPYLVASLLGIAYDEPERQQLVATNDRMMQQYLRAIRLLIGKDGMDEVGRAVKGKPRAMPSSNPQCVRYFHDMLGYPVVRRGKPTKDGTTNPSLAKQAMFKLRLKNDNPVIDFCIAYRETKIETTTPLGFIPWKDDSGQVINPRKYAELMHL